MNLTVVKDGETDVAALWTYARHLESRAGLLRLALEEIIQHADLDETEGNLVRDPGLPDREGAQDPGGGMSKDEDFVYVSCEIMQNPRIRAMSPRVFRRKLLAALRGEINECSLHIRTTAPEETEWVQSAACLGFGCMPKCTAIPKFSSYPTV